MEKHCITCGESMTGRTDKKFCSDQCRFEYNNKKKREQEAPIVGINSLLRKNRSIIRSLNPVGKTTVRRSLLEQLGFNFDFFTHIYRTKNGTTYYFCYDYGYCLAEDEKIVLVTYQRYMKKEIFELFVPRQ